MTKYFHPEKYAHIEIERRFLLDRLPAGLAESATYVRIIDRYITGTRLRLRRMESPEGETLALKLGQKYRPAGQGVAKTVMTNLYLNEAEYGLLANLPGLPLVKRRYPYSFEGHTYAIDEFSGPLAGLVLAEIEDRPGVSITDLPLPFFAIREVTDDIAFTGGELVKLDRHAFEKWFSAVKR